MNDYHITRPDGTQEGPFSEEELEELYRDRKLPQGSLVWTPGWATWKACEDAFSWYAPPPPLPGALNNGRGRKISPFLQDAWLYMAIGFGIIILIFTIAAFWPKIKLGPLAIMGFVFIFKGFGSFRKHSMAKGEKTKATPVRSVHTHGRHKSSIIAGLLAIFLWPVGAHKFYNGSWGWGIIYIVIIVAAWVNPNPNLGILWISEFILALIQGIWWLANPVYYHRKYNETSPSSMKW
ncbi:GYF domain-containing protein [Akkermansia sp. N21116]|uniref:GYF domain-containing protein n=1 Tax=Akkermansia sp. N21116 TaxID=3040764 RepID=UPI002AC8D7E4|nr:GYF domain-containing protein [Akkermansia sp. N21116]WPX41191.1 GYF domain-containing protein [Akkermansia sp. N21116]